MLWRKTLPVGTTSDVFSEAARWRLDGSDTPCPTPDPYEVPSTPKQTLPGPRRKQAQALYENIRWAADTFGAGHLGFLTLTFGDAVRERAVAQARWNSLLTGVFRERYRCGVNVSERHKSGGIHFHLVVVTREDIRGAIDFAAVFPSKEQQRCGIRPDYRSAPMTLRNEWEFLRGKLGDYSFGRHQLQPMKHNADALARYVGKYISKSWEARTPDDKGARLVNYFGQWSKRERINEASKPPWTARHMGLSPQARAWRECLKQVAHVCRLNRIDLNSETVRQLVGEHWALHLTDKLKHVRFWESELTGECALAGMKAHNATVPDGAHVGEIAPVFWFKRSIQEAMEANAVDRAAEVQEADATKIRLLRETLAELTGEARASTVNRECAVPS